CAAGEFRPPPPRRVGIGEELAARDAPARAAAGQGRQGAGRRRILGRRRLQCLAAPAPRSTLVAAARWDLPAVAAPAAVVAVGLVLASRAALAVHDQTPGLD